MQNFIELRAAVHELSRYDRNNNKLVTDTMLSSLAQTVTRP